MELRVHQRFADLDSPAYAALLRPEDTPFLDPRFLRGLEESGTVGGDTGWIPYHLSLHDDRGVMLAAAPAYLKLHSEGEFVFDWGWAEAAERAGFPYYPKLVLGIPFTPATGGRVLVRADQERASILGLFLAAVRQLLLEEHWLHSVHALFTQPDLLAAGEAQGYFVRWGLQFHFHNPGYADFEGFLQSLPSKRRTQLRRERREVAASGITLRTLRPEELLPNAEIAYRLYASTVDKFRWGRRYLNLAFFEHLAREMPEIVRWVVAERGGAIVAGALNMQGPDTLYGRYWGAFEEHPFLHFATCYYEGIESCLRDGLRSFEPGAGGEHKRPRGFSPTKTASLHLIKEPRLARAIDDFLRRERHAIEAHLREER